MRLLGIYSKYSGSTMNRSVHISMMLFALLFMANSAFAAWDDGWSQLHGTDIPVTEGAIQSLKTANNEDGRLEIFAITNNGNLWHKWQLSSGEPEWSDWELMESPAGLKIVHQKQTPVAVSQNEDGRLEIFVRTDDWGIWHKYQRKPNSGWSDWYEFAGADGPSLYDAEIGVVKDESGRLNVFAVGSGRLWHRRQVAPNSGWENWIFRGAPPSVLLRQKPLVRLDRFNFMELIVLGNDGNFWRCLVHGEKWDDWESLGNPTGYENDVQESFIFRHEIIGGTLEVVVRDSDNQFWHMQQMIPWSIKWSGWQAMPENPVPGSKFFDMDIYGDYTAIAYAFIATSDGVFVSRQSFYEYPTTPPSGFPKPYIFYFSNWMPLGSPLNKLVGRFSAGQDPQLGIYSWAPSQPGDMEIWRIKQ